jgi:lipoprotein NlpI
MLVMTEQRIGDAGLALGLQEETLTAYRRDIDILRKQLAVDPQNANARARLETNLAKMGFALLAFGNPESALSFYEEALTVAPRNAELQRNRGLAAFQAGRLPAAIENFATAVKLDANNAYSVVWLHLARNRAGQNDASEFAANADKLDRGKWPWPIVAYLLGKAGAEKVVASATEQENASTRREQTCEANFYLGSMQTKSKPVEAQRLLRAAAAECPKDYVEYAMANSELKRLDGVAAAKRP